MSEITEQNSAAPALSGEVLPPEPDSRALNAVKHGLGAGHVPPSEREAYAAHVQAVRGASGAAGYLQERLADRAALALWRLDRVARYEAAQSASQRRSALGAIEEANKYGPAEHVTAAYERVNKLTYDEPADLRARPQLAEEEARRLEDYAQTLRHWAEGGGAGELDPDAASVLGEQLGTCLLGVKVGGAVLVRAMVGRAAKRGEGVSVEDGGWTYEPAELAGLLGYFRQRFGDHAAVLLGLFAEQQLTKAEAVRSAMSEAQAAMSDALALAALPRTKELDKITRYEAHLERTLYRALHELEAARREGAGQPLSPPIRGVLDGT